MDQMDHIKQRSEILVDLYQQSIVHGKLHAGYSTNLIEKYQLNSRCWNTPELKQFTFNLSYLKSKGLINAEFGQGMRTSFIEITASGCDVVEFLLFGEQLDSNDKESNFKKIMEKIIDSGVNVLETSAVGFLNIAISKLLT